MLVRPAPECPVCSHMPAVQGVLSTGMPLAPIWSHKRFWCSWKIMSHGSCCLLLAHRVLLVSESTLTEDMIWRLLSSPQAAVKPQVCSSEVWWTSQYVCVWWAYADTTAQFGGLVGSFSLLSVVLVCGCHSTTRSSLSLLPLTATPGKMLKGSQRVYSSVQGETCNW